ALSPDVPATAGGDEPTLIQRRTGVPVFVGRQRAQAAQALLSVHPEVNVLVCDDGLQHYALGRDIAIVVFDDRGLGNGWLLPAGLLREPWPPVEKDHLLPHLMLQPFNAPPAPGALPIFGTRRHLAKEAVDAEGRRRPLAEFQNLDVIALAGIARPQVFFDMLRSSGIEPATVWSLPDHADQNALSRLSIPAGATVLCTEKDAVKLWPLMAARPTDERPRVWSVPLQLEIEPAFFEAVDRRLARLTSGGRLSSTDGHQTA
ncbi:MAG: tetraacyldisaccharide 4'-kinase, partial [Hydrogenophaga sp.]|nr:tetraacyldisaccharide 4'-kinase [Hydrogenophaga sp.]